MRCRVHVPDWLTGRVLAAELTTEETGGRPVLVIGGRRLCDDERFELLQFPTENELGAPSFDGGTL